MACFDKDLIISLRALLARLLWTYILSLKMLSALAIILLSLVIL